jgi:hypothetical protein
VLGEFLYQLLDRDTRLLEPGYFGRNLAQAGSTVSFQAANLSDRYFWLRNFAAVVTPGAAQLPLAVSVQVVDAIRFPGVNWVVFQQDFTRPPPAAATAVAAHAKLDAMVPPGSLLNVQAIFNAGVAVNAVNAWFSGFIIPRGNLTPAVL